MRTFSKHAYSHAQQILSIMKVLMRVALQVLDEKGNFKEENFSKLRSEVTPPETMADESPSTSGRGAENGSRGRGRGRGCVMNCDSSH